MDIISRWYGGPPWQQALRFRRGYPSASKERPVVEKRGRGRKWREVKQGGGEKIMYPTLQLRCKSRVRSYTYRYDKIQHRQNDHRHVL